MGVVTNSLDSSEDVILFKENWQDVSLDDGDNGIEDDKDICYCDNVGKKFLRILLYSIIAENVLYTNNFGKVNIIQWKIYVKIKLKTTEL